MTTQPAGEHHTGTLELAGQGNPQQTTARDILAEQLWSEVWDSERPYDEANDPERAACEAATDRVLAVLEPAIRQQVAEQIAAKGNEIAEQYQATAVTHRDVAIERSGTSNGESHSRTAHAYRNKADGAWAVAHAAREIAHTATSCLKFIHGDDGRDWYCVCGHPADDHGMSPSKPGGPCTTCPVEAVKS